jgi:hypothetical protein
MKKSLLHFLLIVLFSAGLTTAAQISPGDLTDVHAHLEGMSNCTKCHILGDKVTNEKCLQCHTELKARVDAGKGYHSSPQLKGKACVTCHNDHHGRKFQIVKFNKETFDHSLTGYKLQGAHAKKVCADCHKPANITATAIRNKKFTYLGLPTACTGCHADYHQKSLATACENCHTFDAFKPASKFSHSRAKFQIIGRHTEVPCEKCHKTGNRNGQKFQEFTGIAYKSCTNCHKDPHQNKFGQNCTECHSEESFTAVKTMNKFDHSRTTFKLENKHETVSCKTCHKGKFTEPLRHDRCIDCHKDYHDNQFVSQGTPVDCSSCHSSRGFAGSSYTIERHNESNYRLEGAHQATPCDACHKKSEKWSFRNIGKKCADCHKDVHQGHISPDYYPGANCLACHTMNNWKDVGFDHSKTKFSLAGPHVKVSCRNCHFTKEESGITSQRFSGLSQNCGTCHIDKHYGQFEEKGSTDCLRCHNSSGWLIPVFDHNKTAFKLDGKHSGVPCIKCHKPVVKDNISFILYKIKDTQCKSCH